MAGRLVVVMGWKLARDMPERREFGGELGLGLPRPLHAFAPGFVSL